LDREVLRMRRPGGCTMGSLGTTHLISLLIAVAITATTCRFITSAVERRNKRCARRFFLLGFFCGWTTGAVLRGRRRGLKALRAAARRADVRHRTTGTLGINSRFAAKTLTIATSPFRGRPRPRGWHRWTPLGCGIFRAATRARMIALTQPLSHRPPSASRGQSALTTLFFS
jgi:hypothetical protein